MHSHPETTTTLLAPKTMAALVVEDDPMVRTTLAQILLLLGYQTIEVGDARAAIAALNAAPQVDILITDVILPGGICGGALAKQVRQMLPGLRILMVSGYGKNKPEIRAVIQAGEALLFKPFNLAQLAAAIATTSTPTALAQGERVAHV